MSRLPFSDATIRKTRRLAEISPPDECDPKVEALVNDLIGRVADKWTMRGGSVCLHSLAGSLSGSPLVDHAAARSGWWKYVWSGVRPPSAECGRTVL